MRQTIELSNEAASALCGAGDVVLRRLESELDCQIVVRGNVVTLDGEAIAGAAAATPAIMEPANSKPPARANMFIADLFIAVSPKPSMDQNVDLL